MSSPLTKNNNLPYLVLVKLFNNLDAKDLSNCRLICKLWKSVIDEKCWIEELSFTYRDQFNLCDKKSNKWYYLDESINDGNKIYNCNLELIKSIPLKLDQLKRLNIDCVFKFCLKNDPAYRLTRNDNRPNHKFDFNLLNKFINLELLEVDRFHIYQNTKLLLPNLSILSFGMVDIANTNDKCYKKNYELKINAIKLEILRCGHSLDNIKFKYPLTIKNLTVNTSSLNLSEFKNVEIFRTSDLESVYIYCNQENLIDQLPRLKELHLIQESENSQFSYYKIECLDDALQMKDDLKVYFLDYLLDGNKEAKQYKLNELFPFSFKDEDDESEYYYY